MASKKNTASFLNSLKSTMTLTGSRVVEPEYQDYEDEKLRRAREIYNNINNSYVGNSNEQRAAMNAALNSVMETGPAYGNYMRADLAQAAYNRDRKLYSQYIGDVNSFTNGNQQVGYQSAQDRALTNAEMIARTNNGSYQNTPKYQNKIKMDAINSKLGDVSNNNDLDINLRNQIDDAVKLANKGKFAKAEKAFNQIKSEQGWTDDQLNMYVSNAKSMYDYDESVKDNLSSSEQILKYQNDIGNLSRKERSLLDEYVKSAEIEGSAMENQKGYLLNKAGVRSTKEIEKELKGIGKWDSRTLSNYLDEAKTLGDYNATTKAQSVYDINQDDSELTQAAKRVRNWTAGVLGDVAGSVPAAFEDKFRIGNGYDQAHRLFNVSDYASGQSIESLNDGGLVRNAIDGTKVDNVLDKVDTVSQAITGQNAAQNLYSGTQAAAVSYITAYVGGAAGKLAKTEKGAKIISDVVGFVPFFAASYESAYQGAREDGLTESQARALANVAGATEVLTEKLPYENLIRLLDGEGEKQLFKAALKQAGGEAFEESIGNLVNKAADFAITADGGKSSEFRKLEQEALASGEAKTEAEAERIATIKMWQTLGADAVGGLISGGMSGSAAAISGVHKSGQVKKQANEISETYSNLAANTDDMTAKEKYEQIAKNPYQKLADDSVTEEGKKSLQDVADKVDSGKKATISDRASVAESITINNSINDAVMNENDKKSVVPEEYKTKRTEITADEGYKMMNEAAGKGDGDTMLKVRAEMENSTDANARAAAQDTLDALRAKAEANGATNLDSNIATQQDAYLAGLNEQEIQTENESLKEAYNAGKMKAIDIKSRTMIQSRDSLKSVKATVGDESVTIERLTGDKVVVSNGETYNLDELNIEDTGAGNFIRQTQYIKGDMAKQAFLDNAEDGAVLNVYSEEFNKVYKAAQADIPLADVKGISMLSDEAKQNIYDAGLKDQYSDGKKKAVQSLHNMLSIERGTGVCTDYRKGIHLDSSYLIGSAVANVTGLNVVIAKGTKDNINADFNASTSTITVYGTAQMKQLFHEVGEFMEFYNSEGHNELRVALNAVALDVLGGEGYARWHDNYKTGYANAGDIQSNKDITNEMANDLMVAMMETSRGRKAMAKYLAENMDQTKAQEFASKFSNMIASISDSIKSIVNNKDNSFQAAVLRKGAHQLAANADKFIEELDKAIKTYQSGEVKNVEKGVKNSRNISDMLNEDANIRNTLISQFESRVKSSLANPNGRDNVLVMDHTPSILRAIGMSDDKIYITKGHLVSMNKPKSINRIHYHGLSPAQIAQGIDTLYDPALIVDSAKYPSSVILISDKTDADQWPMIIVMRPYGEATVGFNYLDSNFMKTEYGVNNFNDWVDNNIEQDKILYAEKNKTQKVLGGLSLKALSLSTLSYDSILHQSENIVNILDDNSRGKALSPNVLRYFRNSKVTDDRRRLLPIYHGSNDIFTQFDSSKFGLHSGTKLRGIWTSSNKNTAYQYGNNIIEGYINITNPVSLTDKITNKSDWMAFAELVCETFPTTAGKKLGDIDKVVKVVGSIYRNKTSDYEILNAFEKLMDNTELESFYKLVYDSLGIDGYILNNNGETIAVAFLSEQIKDITNVNPTNNPDIHMSVDITGKELTPGQQEYFKDSQMRDENGALKRYYHGTVSYGFDVFDISKAKSTGLYGKGFYFGDSSIASNYGKTYEVYLNIVNPLKNGTKDITRDQLLKLVNAVANDEDMGIYNYGYSATPQSIVDSLMGRDDFAMLQDINATCVGDFAGLVKLFNRLNDTSYDGIQAKDQVIAFYSNQIKDINNENPTNDENIYHSIQVAEFDNLEEESKKTKGVSFGKTLIAVHNLGVEQLRGIFELGGLPSPSIAIIKAGMEHSKYGPISIMFKKDAIDPAVSKKNKVYSGDAWTPTFPRVEVKISEKAADAIWDKLNGLVTESDQKALGYLNVDSSTMQDNANSARGSLVDAYSSKDIFKLAYLRDKGIDVPEVPTREERLNQSWKNDQIQYVANLVDSETVYEFRKQGYRSFEENKDLAEKFRQALNQHFKEYMKNQAKDKTNISKLLGKDFYEEFTFSDWDNLTAGIYKYYRDGIRNQVDPYAYKDAVRSAVTDEADYEAWLSDLFKDAVEKKGLRNNKDVFTYSGNRRSWEALHDEYTLDNVVKIMNQDESKGADAIFTQSVIKALATKEFKSIADIHKSENQIQMVSDEEYDAINKEWQDRVNDIVEDIYSRSNSNIFMAHDSAMEAIADAIKRSSTVSGMQRVYDEYKSFLNIKEDTAQKTYDLLQYLKEIPTGYFEAKPRRAVWLEEIGKVILPSNTDVDIINQLEDNGIAYEMYEAGNEAERTAILADSSDLRFSVGIEDDFFFSNENLVSVEEDVASTREATSVLEKGMEALKHTQVSEKVVKALAAKIKKQTGSSINIVALSDNISKVFAYMQGEDFVDYADMMGIIKEVARPVVDMATEKVGVEVYEDFISRVKGYSIRLTDTQKQEVKSAFGSYGRFRSMMMPMNISDKGTVTLEQVWQELSEASGYILDYDTTEGEMPLQLYDVLTSMRPTLENTFGADAEEVAQDLAMQIVEEYFVEAGKDEANKKNAAKLKEASDAMRDANKQYRAELKKRYDEQIKELKKEANYNVKWRDAEHDAIIKEIKARNKQRSKQIKENRIRREQRDKLKKDAAKLYKRVADPTEKSNVPTDMVIPVLEFMNALDLVEPAIKQNADGKWVAKVFSHMEGKTQIYKDVEADTKEEAAQKVKELIYEGAGSKAQQTWTERMSKLGDLYNKAKNNSNNFDDVSMLDFVQLMDPDLSDELSDLLSRNRGTASINQLDSDDIRTLRRVIANVNHAITQRDKVLSAGVNARISELASTLKDYRDKIVSPSGEFEKKRGELLNEFRNLLRVDMLNASTFMTLLGDAGDKLYSSLRSGLNKEIHNIKTASKFVEQTKKDLGITDKDIAGWYSKDFVMSFSLGDGTLRLTPMQIMSLYETSKRAGAMDRIIEGIKATDIKVGVNTYSQSKSYHVNQADIKMITDTLTDTQKAFADALQRYMATDCATQGNEVSRTLYGYEKYIDETYFPYRVDQTSVASTDQSVNTKSMTGEHVGFTKALQKGASNVLMIDDIFSVFSNHVSEMSKYNGYTVANKDVVRWLNYKEITEGENGRERETVKESINSIVGDESGVKYIENLLSDIAGNGAGGTKAGKFIDKIASGYKAAAVMGNLRVVLQQPTAYFRALNMIDPKYLFTVNVTKAFKDIERVNELSDIAWWKAQGYFETNIGQSLESVITGRQNFRDVVNDKAGWLAGKADDLTWALLYQAVEKEQKAALGNASEEEFRKAVNKRFDKLIDSTQVVDATLLRSQFMRDKNGIKQLESAFMAEPTKSYNMLAEAVIKDYRDSISGKKTVARTARAFTAFTISAIATAAAAAVMDAIRYDDDDTKWDEVWLENFISNFLDNENIIKLVPWMKDVWDIGATAVKGERAQSLSRYDLDAVQGTAQALSNAWKWVNGTSTKTTYGNIMNLVKPLSQLTGIPAYSVARDLTALYNLIGNQFDAGLRTTQRTATDYKKGVTTSIDRGDSVEEITEQVTEAVENSTSILDVRNATKNMYKQMYFDAVDASELGVDDPEAKRIAELASKGLVATLMTDDEADEEINSWLDEKKTYGKLDKAIKAGDTETISIEISELLEQKKPEKINEHILKYFGDTVKYEETYETDSNWKEIVDYAFKQVDPESSYESVTEWQAEELKKEAEKAQASAEKAEKKQSVLDAVENNDPLAFNKAMDDYVGQYKEVSTGKSQVKKVIKDQYKDQYIEAYNSKDLATANSLETLMAKNLATVDKKYGNSTAEKKPYYGDYLSYERDQVKKLLEGDDEETE